MSILQQSAASGKGDGSSGSSGDEKQDDGNPETRRDSRRSSGGSNPAAVAEKWTAMFEARDRAGTGRATVEALQGVLEEVNSLM